jgi:hypothetical protein
MALDKAMYNVEKNVLAECAEADSGIEYLEETHQMARPDGLDNDKVFAASQIECVDVDADPSSCGTVFNEQDLEQVESNSLVGCPEATVAHASIEKVSDMLSCSGKQEVEQTEVQDQDQDPDQKSEQVQVQDQDGHGPDDTPNDVMKGIDKPAKLSDDLLREAKANTDALQTHETSLQTQRAKDAHTPNETASSNDDVVMMKDSDKPAEVSVSVETPCESPLPADAVKAHSRAEKERPMPQAEQISNESVQVAKQEIVSVTEPQKMDENADTEELQLQAEQAKAEAAEAQRKVRELELRLQAQQAKAEAAQAQRQARELEEKLRAVQAELEAQQGSNSMSAAPVEVTAQIQVDAKAHDDMNGQNDADDADAPLQVALNKAQEPRAQEQESLNCHGDEDDADAPLAPSKVEPCTMVERSEAKASQSDGCATPEDQVEQPSVEVLLLVDASSAAHVPWSLAHTPVDEWDENAWDEFGKHLRLREDPCRLEPLGLQTLAFLAPALRGLIVETQLCGEDASEPLRHKQFDPVSAGKLWKRSLLGGTALWQHAVTSAQQLRSKGLKCVIMIASGADGRSEEPYCGDEGARKAAVELLGLGLPVHCLTLGAPKAECQCREVAARTGGLFVSLPAATELREEEDSAHATALKRLVQSLGNLPRRDGELDPQSFLEAAATVIQHAYRARVRHLKRQKILRYKAALRIAAAYSRWRLRRSIHEAAKEAKRWRRAAPVRAAEKARADAVREVEMTSAAKVLQSYWRARKITLWCQRIDKGARRLQGWFRRRKARQEAAKWRKMQILKRKGAADPPPVPPSQWLVPEPEVKVEKEEPKAGFVLGKRAPQAWEVRPRDHLPSSMCPCPVIRPPDRPRSRGEETAILLPTGYADLSVVPPSLPKETTLPSPRRHLTSLHGAAPAVPCARNPAHDSSNSLSSTQPVELLKTPRLPPSPRHSNSSFCRRVPPMSRSLAGQNRMSTGTAMPAIGMERGRRAMDRTFL